MQVNSAQDYLTAHKRRIVAASFANTPPPAQRRYNYVYLSILANKETRYNRVAYPQTLSLAPGSVPGGVYTSSGGAVTAGVRPVTLGCVNCATNSGLPGTLV